mgnify:FL=1
MHTPSPVKAPGRIAFFLLATCRCCLAAILLPRHQEGTYIADVYQDGILILSIPLDQASSLGGQEVVFPVEGKDHCYNQIEIRDGAIGITAADCPDKLCVRQGFLHTPGIPITCLPNRLVIQIRPAEPDLPAEHTDPLEPDMITY